MPWIIAGNVSRGGTAYLNRGIQAMQGHRLHVWQRIISLAMGAAVLKHYDYNMKYTHTHTYELPLIWMVHIHKYFCVLL